MKAVTFILATAHITSSTHLRSTVPAEAYGYAHADDASAAATSSSTTTTILPQSSADSLSSSSSTSLLSTTSNHNVNLENSMEHLYDQSPRFKSTQEQTSPAARNNGFGYNSYFHAHHNVPADRVAAQTKVNAKLSDPHFWAKDGGAYDTWKSQQMQTHTAALEALRFQQQRVELVEEPEAAEKDATTSTEPEEPAADGEAGAATSDGAAAAAAAAETGPAEDELIAAAQERVSTAATHAGVIHTDVVGTTMAIKDTLKESSSHVGEAHEQGPAGEDILEHLKAAESSARQVNHLREVKKKKERADVDAKAALEKAQDALAALKEQRRVAGEMRNEETAKQAQHEKDKVDAATWPPVAAESTDESDVNGSESGDESGSESNDVATEPTLSKRQKMFKELGERLLRLAMPSEKRKSLVEHLDENLKSMTTELNTTSVERTMLAKRVEALEKEKVEEEAKKRGDAADKETKMQPGAQLQWIEQELTTASKALEKMGPIAQKIAQEAAKKKTAAGAGDEEESSLMEEHESPEIVKTIAKDANVVDENDDSAVKPKTVASLSHASGEGEKEEEEDEMTYATVVKDDPNENENENENNSGEEGDNQDDAADSSGMVPEPVLPTDPTSPGQTSVADQVYNALGGAETFDAAEKKVHGSDKNPQSLNTEPREDATTSTTTTEVNDNKPSFPLAAETSKEVGKKKNIVEAARETFDDKDGALPKLSTTTSPERFGEEEEAVARLEIVGAKKDAEVATARVKYAQQRHLESSQQEQLKTAIKMSAAQDRQVDVKKKYLAKAKDEELVSITRMEAAEKSLTKDPQNNVQKSVLGRLKEATEARKVVVQGREQDVNDEIKSSKDHRELVEQIRQSIRAEEAKEDELRKARDQQVKQQQTIAEQVADAQAKYGLRHDVQKLIQSSTSALPNGSGEESGSGRRSGNGTPGGNADGAVAKELAKEGKTFTDAAEWRLELVRTGKAGPIHIPTKTTKEERNSAVGAYVGSQRGASLGATHDITAAAAAMKTAGVEQYPVLLEIKSNQGLAPKPESSAAEDALAEATRARQLISKRFMQTEEDMVKEQGVLSPETLSRVSSLALLETKKDNAQLEVGTGTLLAKSRTSLERALTLRQQAEKEWKKTSIAQEKTSFSHDNSAASTSGMNMFHDLPSIKGDQLFEDTRQFLTGSNPFDHNVVGGGGGGAAAAGVPVAQASVGAPSTTLSDAQRDMFLENSAQYTTGAILKLPNQMQHSQQQQQQQPPMRMLQMQQGQQHSFPLPALVAEGVLPDVNSPLPDLM
jgi:hypothetical protein